MAISQPAPDERAPRRIVLIDFDWLDAELVPELLRQPALTVGLIAGHGPDDAGVRLAELCGVPHTLELSDLTREIFDLALIGERSSRRSHVERLLTALGTPVATPRHFLGGAAEPVAAEVAAGESAGAGAHTAALDAMFDDVLPSLDAPDEPVESAAAAPDVPADPSEMPGPDDDAALEATLKRWAESTDARAAEIHVRRGDEVERVCRTGEDDPLLDALVQLAIDLGRPHVVSQMEGPERGKAWGAWPFRTVVRSGCVAAAAIDPVEGRAMWEHMVDDLRASWDVHERRTRARAAGPRTRRGSEGARGSLEQALDQNRDEGVRYEAHRMTFDGPPPAVEALVEAMAPRLRESDFIHPLGGREVLLLCSGPPAAFARIRRRLLTGWEQAWTDSGQSPPAPPFLDERIELLDVVDAARFESIVLGWIADR